MTCQARARSDFLYGAGLGHALRPD